MGFLHQTLAPLGQGQGEQSCQVQHGVLMGPYPMSGNPAILHWHHRKWGGYTILRMSGGTLGLYARLFNEAKSHKSKISSYLLHNWLGLSCNQCGSNTSYSYLASSLSSGVALRWRCLSKTSSPTTPFLTSAFNLSAFSYCSADGFGEHGKDTAEGVRVESDTLVDVEDIISGHWRNTPTSPTPPTSTFTNLTWR